MSMSCFRRNRIYLEDKCVLPNGIERVFDGWFRFLRETIDRYAEQFDFNVNADC